MEHFLDHLKERNYQKRRVAIIENGSWAPSSGRCMKKMLQEMKNLDIIEQTVTIKSRMNKQNEEQMNKLAEELLK